MEARRRFVKVWLQLRAVCFWEDVEPDGCEVLLGQKSTPPDVPTTRKYLLASPKQTSLHSSRTKKHPTIHSHIASLSVKSSHNGARLVILVVSASYMFFIHWPFMYMHSPTSIIFPASQQSSNLPTPGQPQGLLRRAAQCLHVLWCNAVCVLERCLYFFSEKQNTNTCKSEHRTFIVHTLSRPFLASAMGTVTPCVPTLLCVSYSVIVHYCARVLSIVFVSPFCCPISLAMRFVVLPLGSIHHCRRSYCRPSFMIFLLMAVDARTRSCSLCISPAHPSL